MSSASADLGGGRAGGRAGALIPLVSLLALVTSLEKATASGQLLPNMSPSPDLAWSGPGSSTPHDWQVLGPSWILPCFLLGPK